MIVNDKLMKFILFKKRTENEVRKKCITLNYQEDYIDEVIEYLKEAEYIDDQKYIEKYINEVIKLKHMSIVQIRNDLIMRGINSSLVDNILSNDLLNKFEAESAEYLLNKKIKSGEDLEKVKRFLLNKGYSYSNILKAIDNLENIDDN